MVDTNEDEKLKKIREQIEFYFSDSNFPRDKFLRSKAALNEEGCKKKIFRKKILIFFLKIVVDISVISSFQRIKKLTEDQNLIVKALKDSTKLILNPEGTMVRRKEPIPDESQLKINERTLYTVNFFLNVM